MTRQNLIDLRGSKTQEEIAKQLGISQKYLSRIELGQRTPSAKILGRFPKVYGKTVEELFPDIFLE